MDVPQVITAPVAWSTEGMSHGDHATYDPAVEASLRQAQSHPVDVRGALVSRVVNDEHVAVRRARYAPRRDVLHPALEAGALTIAHSGGGLYLWATRHEPCADTISALVDLGIVAVPGDEYGVHGAHHVRFALTAPDADVALAAERLRTLSRAKTT